MSTLLERLHRDHAILRRLLDLLSSQLDDFFAGRESNFDLKIELLDFIEHYAEQIHHRTEDLIFQVAKNRCPEDGELFERIGGQHHDLEAMTRRFRETLEGVIQGEVMPREEVEVRGREFVALQRQHIDQEEQEIFPLLEKCLAAEDWETLLTEVPLGEDVLFSREDFARFRGLIEFLSGHGNE
ncbi:MAG: hemerythrin domain-containing protein [gamma proteobacterium endosymbiont of Lamellibrachia anaximandri]|nr:hemerythrin domain-containing protein [gamma proteobacterium endosymbiont of Lamellibrachia anaximandri]